MWTKIGKTDIIKRTKADRELVRLQEGAGVCPDLHIVREVKFDPIKDHFEITTWERKPD